MWETHHVEHCNCCISHVTVKFPAVLAKPQTVACSATVLHFIGNRSHTVSFQLKNEDNETRTVKVQWYLAEGKHTYVGLQRSSPHNFNIQHHFTAGGGVEIGILKCHRQLPTLRRYFPKNRTFRSMETISVKNMHVTGAWLSNPHICMCMYIRYDH